MLTSNEKERELLSIKSPWLFQKLYSSHLLETSNPDGLQNNFFVEIMVHLWNRGRENLHEMTRGDFHIWTDSRGKRYVCVSDKRIKNHREMLGIRKATKQECMRLVSRDTLCRHLRSMLQNYTLTVIASGNCLTETLIPTIAQHDTSRFH